MVDAKLRGKNTKVSVRTGGDVTPDPVGDTTDGGDIRLRLFPLLRGSVIEGRLSTAFSWPGEGRKTGHLWTRLKNPFGNGDG